VRFAGLPVLSPIPELPFVQAETGYTVGSALLTVAAHLLRRFRKTALLPCRNIVQQVAGVFIT
jgi:hypothetical protein